MDFRINIYISIVTFMIKLYIIAYAVQSSDAPVVSYLGEIFVIPTDIWYINYNKLSFQLLLDMEIHSKEIRIYVCKLEGKML